MDQVGEVKGKTDIINLIGGYVNLKKAGKNFKANCPFHNEKTPSFMLSPELQMYKCFGCGESGDALTFLEKYEGMTFYEALKYLAEKAGIKLLSQNFDKGDIKEKIMEINRNALRFYHYVLTSHPSGSEALKYLTQKRGLTLTTIENFKIGFSPNKTYALIDYLSKKKQFKTNDIGETGIFYNKNGSLYDRFRGRVVFPLMDHRGNVAGFAGRILPKDEGRDLAKYVNTPETKVYYKSKLLFPLHIAKEHLRDQKRAIIVEGELDAISCWQAGIRNVVAIKGSALSEEQIRLLKRFCTEVVFALDSDIAGNEAAKRGISIAEKEGVETKVAEIPSTYKDPDEMVRKDASEFKKIVEKSKTSWDYLIESVFRKQNDDKSQLRSTLSRDIVRILLLISDEILKAHYINLVAKRLEIPYEAVEKQLNREEKSGDTFERELIKSTAIDKKDRKQLLEERLLSIAFQSNPGEIIKKDYLKLFSSPLAVRMFSSYLEFIKEKKYSVSLFKKYLDPELLEGFSLLILDALNVDYENISTAKKEAELVVNNLKTLNMKELLSNLQKNIDLAEKRGDDKEVADLEKRFSLVSEELNALEANGRKSIILH